MGKYIIDIDERYISKDDGIMVTNENGNITAYVPVEPYNEYTGEELLTALRGVLRRMPVNEVAERFDGTAKISDIIKGFSAERIISRYNEWNKIPEVGDEVISEITGHKLVVTGINSDKTAVYGMDGNGCFCQPAVKYCKKTGRHFDSVKKLLREIGE